VREAGQADAIPGKKRYPPHPTPPPPPPPPHFPTAVGPRPGSLDRLPRALPLSVTPGAGGVGFFVLGGAVPLPKRETHKKQKGFLFSYLRSVCFLMLFFFSLFLSFMPSWAPPSKIRTGLVLSGGFFLVVVAARAVWVPGVPQNQTLCATQKKQNL